MSDLYARTRLRFVMETVGYALLLLGFGGMAAVAVEEPWVVLWAVVGVGLLMLLRKVPWPVEMEEDGPR